MQCLTVTTRQELLARKHQDTPLRRVAKNAPHLAKLAALATQILALLASKDFICQVAHANLAVATANNALLLLARHVGLVTT
jgi:hypothetical protein